MMIWHPDAQRINVPSAWSRPRRGTVKRVVLAMTELPRKHVLSAYEQAKVAPHLTIDPVNGEVWQHLPFEADSKGVAVPFPPSLIDGGTIVVALIGRSSDTASWGEEWLGNVRDVLAPVLEAFDIPREHPQFFGSSVADVTSVNARQRMVLSRWKEFAGVCGMQHVPATTRWDPGLLDVDALLATGEKVSLGALPAFSREIKKNSKSKAVSQWQQSLGLEDTGRFDAATYDATIEVQRALGVKVDGVVGEVTWAAACEAGKPVDALGGYAGVDIKHGTVGAVVARWQTQIGVEPTGVFDKATVEATKKYQLQIGVAPTGVVDENTWAQTRFKTTQW